MVKPSVSCSCLLMISDKGICVDDKISLCYTASNIKHQFFVQFCRQFCFKDSMCLWVVCWRIKKQFKCNFLIKLWDQKVIICAFWKVDQYLLNHVKKNQENKANRQSTGKITISFRWIVCWVFRLQAVSQFCCKACRLHLLVEAVEGNRLGLYH